MITICEKCNRKFVEAGELCDSCRANEIENEFYNKDIVIDEQNEINWEEVHGACQDKNGDWRV